VAIERRLNAATSERPIEISYQSHNQSERCTEEICLLPDVMAAITKMNWTLPQARRNVKRRWQQGDRVRR
jgi:hypothetical protein